MSLKYRLVAQWFDKFIDAKFIMNYCCQIKLFPKFSFVVAQGQKYGTPNENPTHIHLFAICLNF